MPFKGLFVLIAVIVLAGSGEAQEYPFWFLHQGTVNCSPVAIGYSEKSPQRDSMVSYALANAALNFAAFKSAVIKGEQTYWGTEAGKYRMSALSEEVVDGQEVDRARRFLHAADSFENNGCMIVLGADSGCVISAQCRERIALSLMKSPLWTEEIPKIAGYIYAAGLAPSYYYQSSSWLEAERLARRNLARAISVEIKGMQKFSREGQSVECLQSDVSLQNIEVVERWVDNKANLFYVLIRCKVN
jgi:hypothetical protein